MNLRPVIAREMRVQARQGFTYWMRVLGAGALMLAVWWGYQEQQTSAVAGLRLFAVLHATLYLLIWVLVPLVTADCLSREKRQGTLGLLFLTPLKAFEIVFAKGLVHGLRSSAMCLAVVPVLTLPFLMGGVSWSDAVVALLLYGSAFCLALSAGVLASAYSTKWFRALVVAEILAQVFQWCFLTYYGYLFLVMGNLKGLWPLRDHTLWELTVNGTSFAWAGMTQKLLWGFPPGAQKHWLVVTVIAFIISLLACLLPIGLAARKVRGTWQEEVASPARQWLQDLFCSPMFFLPLFRRWMRYKIQANPIGWLEQRTWSGRMIVWAWFGIMISFYSVALSSVPLGREVFKDLQNIIAMTLVVSIAITSAGSFQRERETGLLELLLVSPLKTGQILSGRLRGIWGQFLLAVVLQIALWIYLVVSLGNLSYHMSDALAWQHIIFYTCTYLTLPVIGLFYSLARRHFISALFWTFLSGVIFPIILGGILRWFLDWTSQYKTGVIFYTVMPTSSPRYGGASESLFRFSVEAGVVQILLAILFGMLLYNNLVRRKFALERGD